MPQKIQSFTNRWGLLLAMLGMAVGTGNIWRFPRIAASNGGGTFLVAWVMFLLIWSVPLILVEFALGKRIRMGAVGTFSEMLGPKFAWLGAFVAFVAAAIGCYYAVVMGWTIRFFLGAVMGHLENGQSEAVWEGFAFTPVSVWFHLAAVVLAALVVAGGVKGIERAARILMPALIVLVVVLAIRAVTLPGAERGLNFLFTPDWSQLGNYRIWLEALTQNAWDTGAGWGLVLTYAIYTGAKEDTNLNAFILAFGNNAISLLAGIMVLCTIFSIRPDAASTIVGQGNEGLTFVWIPQLFNQMPGGRVFMIFFFMALVFAAWTSMVAMMELIVRLLTDAGLERRKILPFLGPLVFLCGLPSALWEPFFRNQDYVWSVALMLCGLGFAVIVFKYGVTKFRHDFLNTAENKFKIGAWWDWVIRLVAIEAVALLLWCFWQVRTLPLFDKEGIGNMVTQWVAVAVVFYFLNSLFVRGYYRAKAEQQD